ncbi:MAG: hypothetical protein ACKVOR_03670 [Flavobacteriales bacterium]
MKKVLFAFFALSFTSLAAAAGNELTATPGDPKKEEKKEETFTISKSSFSLFNLFFLIAPSADTLQIVPAAVEPKHTVPAKK